MKKMKKEDEKLEKQFLLSLEKLILVFSANCSLEKRKERRGEKRKERRERGEKRERREREKKEKKNSRNFF